MQRSQGHLHLVQTQTKTRLFVRIDHFASEVCFYGWVVFIFVFVQKVEDLETRGLLVGQPLLCRPSHEYSSGIPNPAHIPVRTTNESCEGLAVIAIPRERSEEIFRSSVFEEHALFARCAFPLRARMYISCTHANRSASSSRGQIPHLALYFFNVL